MNYNQNGKKNPNYKHGKSLVSNYCLDCNKKIGWRSKRCTVCFHKNQIKTNKQHLCEQCQENKICYKNWKYGSKICKSCRNRINWKNINYRKTVRIKMLRSLLTKPNKPERLTSSLLRQILPKEYKFVGDGQVIIDGFNPDFINCNGQKKIVELYGDYWHNREEVIERDKRRLISYKKYGYKTLIIWEKELKDLEVMISKIMEFNLTNV